MAQEELSEKPKEVDTYALRCFLGETRKLTHELTREEARIFRWAARHLDRYLTSHYDLPEDKE